MKKILSILDKIEEYVMYSLLVVMFVTVLAQIVSRYIFNSPLLFTEEISLLSFLWVTMLGTGFCFKHNLNTRITLLIDLFSDRVKGVINIVINTACAGLMCFFFFPALRFTITQSKVTSPTLPIQMSVKYVSFVIACILVLVRTTETSLKLAHMLRGKEATA